MVPLVFWDDYNPSSRLLIALILLTGKDRCGINTIMNSEFLYSHFSITNSVVILLFKLPQW